MSPCALEPNSLDLVLGKPLFRSVIELCRPRTLVCRHFLSVLERSAVRRHGGASLSPSGAADRRPAASAPHITTEIQFFDSEIAR